MTRADVSRAHRYGALISTERGAELKDARIDWIDDSSQRMSDGV